MTFGTRRAARDLLRLDLIVNNFLKKPLDFMAKMGYIITMKEMKNKRNNELTKAGAPRPATTSNLWNEWAANNPQPEAIALANLKVNNSLMMSMKGICQGARPIEN